mmetsp:Transcript_25475/g.54814  ORF Transcript_25475/g.54814 Transcript_25475/m.54814 type:complete len:230 (-) Transcript_25475:185-874(-)
MANRSFHEEGRPGAIGSSPSFVEGVHDKSTRGIAKINTGSEPTASLRVETDVRVPETPIDGCSSPGARLGDDEDIPTSSLMVMTSYCSPPSSTVRRKRTTAMEAYKKGMLFQYIMDSAAEFECCRNRDSTVDYETKWDGHQPLTPHTWSFVDDDTASIVSASELRLNRRRRRRGVLTPSQRNGKIGIDSPTIAEDGSNDFFPSIPYPGDIADPQTSHKKKWQPNCDGAA